MENNELNKQVKAMQAAIKALMGTNGSQTPKAIENAVLVGLYEVIPAGSYLSSLVSKDLVKWFRYQTEMDLDTNVMDWRYAEGKRDGEQLGQQAMVSDLKSAEVEIAGLQKLLAAEQAKVKSLDSQMASQQARIDRLSDDINSLVNQGNEMAAELQAKQEVVEAVEQLAGRLWFTASQANAEVLRQTMMAAGRSAAQAVA